MTREEILAMQPGRELDLLVMNKVTKYVSPTTALNLDGTYGHIPAYSTDIAAAWEVVEHLNGQYSFQLRRLGDYFEQDPDYGWEAIFTSHENRKVIANTAPEAICKAALIHILEEERP